ncbi:hypothetical protein [Pseudomonas leptonychotis]|uniref:hypothetical protein n=1 Tax=Pseudomonas leptonychotis TaxID=2448482 RepID=UPI00386E6A28
MASLQLVSPPVQRPMSITAPEFLPKLAEFNELTRSVRDAGLQITAMSFLDNTIIISIDSVELLARRFGHEVRGQRHRTEGRFTRNAVTIRGVDVVWFSLVKEQNQ